MRSNSIAITFTMLALMLPIPAVHARRQGHIRKGRVYTERINMRRNVYTKQSKSKEDEFYRQDNQNNVQPQETQNQMECTVSIGDGYESIGCDENEYCHLLLGECNAFNNEDRTLFGTCREIIHRCTREYKPVCGCNGRTYSNKCVAASKGVSVKHDRPCMTH